MNDKLRQNSENQIPLTSVQSNESKQIYQSELV